MPDVRPFRGVRYDLARIGALSSVVAPPYDVIGQELQDRLHEMSPYNIVRLELGRDEASDGPERNRYTRADRLLRDWQRTGILQEDQHPALYLVSQKFSVDGQSFTRSGFLARVRLEPFGQGSVYPHEQTLSGPKADRLALYRATRFNLSPVFGLYPDPDASVFRALEAKLSDHTPLEAIDHLGVVNHIWPVLDPEAHTAVQGLMGGRKIFIADGHHRYETGCTLRDELAAAGSLTGPDDPAHF
ncbi:MAG TPA: DUF1015 domain-containing protein, partial [Isosphaeraceae bacterium]|nr:DUF1015 domain-containing protein [Isosphaeraceae bacterium]